MSKFKIKERKKEKEYPFEFEGNIEISFEDEDEYNNVISHLVGFDMNNEGCGFVKGLLSFLKNEKEFRNIGN